MVRELVRANTGHEPFWVADEFCYEAEALGQVFSGLVAKLKPNNKWDDNLLSRLQDEAYCTSLGLSNIQRELLRRAASFTGEGETHPDSDYGHVIYGYFYGNVGRAKEMGIEMEPRQMAQTFNDFIVRSTERRKCPANINAKPTRLSRRLYS